MDADREPAIDLRLYVAGGSPRSRLALRVVSKLCAERLPRSCHLEVVDVLREPRTPGGSTLTVVPMLKRLRPGPERRYFGKAWDPDRIVEALELRVTGDPHGG